MSLCLLRLTVSPYNVCCTTAAAVEKKTLRVAVLGGRYLREMKIEKAGEEKKKENLLVYLHNVRLKTEIIQLLFSAHFLVLVLADKIFNSHLSTQHSNNQKTVKLLAPTETEFQ